MQFNPDNAIESDDDEPFVMLDHGTHQRLTEIPYGKIGGIVLLCMLLVYQLSYLKNDTGGGAGIHWDEPPTENKSFLETLKVLLMFSSMPFGLPLFAYAVNKFMQRYEQADGFFAHPPREEAAANEQRIRLSVMPR